MTWDIRSSIALSSNGKPSTRTPNRAAHLNIHPDGYGISFVKVTSSSRHAPTLDLQAVHL